MVWGGCWIGYDFKFVGFQFVGFPWWLFVLWRILTFVLGFFGLKVFGFDVKFLSFWNSLDEMFMVCFFKIRICGKMDSDAGIETTAVIEPVQMPWIRHFSNRPQ